MKPPYPNGHTFRKVAGIGSFKQYVTRAKKPPEGRVGRLSMATDAALRHWWAHARETQKLLHTALDEGFDWHGGNAEWPDWVSLEALAQEASRQIDTYIPKSMLAVWLTQQGIEKSVLLSVRKNRRGRVIYQSNKTCYNVGAYRSG